MSSTRLFPLQSKILRRAGSWVSMKPVEAVSRILAINMECMKLIKILLAVLGRTTGYIIYHHSLIRFRTNGVCRSLLSFVI